jgi:hypothetical protein
MAKRSPSSRPLPYIGCSRIEALDLLDIHLNCSIQSRVFELVQLASDVQMLLLEAFYQAVKVFQRVQLDVACVAVKELLSQGLCNYSSH